VILDPITQKAMGHEDACGLSFSQVEHIPLTLILPSAGISATPRKTCPHSDHFTTYLPCARFMRASALHVLRIVIFTSKLVIRLISRLQLLSQVFGGINVPSTPTCCRIERVSLAEGYRQAKGSMEGGRTGYQQPRQLGNKGIKGEQGDK